MNKTGIFYASKSGTTEAFAKQIAEKLGADVHNMKKTGVDVIADYRNVILMSSNYFFGSLAEDWGSKVKLLHTVDFSKKNVAVVGVGSQERHPDSFCSGAADFFISKPFFLEVMPHGCGKGEAIAFLSDRLGIDRNETMAFGDSMNDESMIRMSGHGVAMLNGLAAIRDAAAYVTRKTNDEDGIADFLEAFVL